MLLAYEPIRDYGWGIIVQQPSPIAFLKKNKDLNIIIFTFGLILLLTIGLSIIVLRTLLRQKESEEKIIYLNRQLNEHIGRLEVANHELDAFTYSASHDLMAPVRVINGFANILKKEYANIPDENTKPLVDMIENETIHMEKLINDLLAFARPGKKDLQKTSVDMTELFREVASDIVTFYFSLPGYK